MGISWGPSIEESTGKLLREYRRPNCGTSESKEGCQDSQKCTDANLRKGDRGATETNHWLDQTHDHPSDLVAAGLEALDLLNFGVAVTNGSRKLLLTNRTAEQILATRDGLELTPQGVLGTLNRCCSPPLSVVIQKAAQGTPSGKPSPKDAVLAVQRPSGKRPLTLLVRSVQGKASRPDATHTVLVFMLDPEFPIHATEAGLRHLYELTPSEARLAHVLMSGKTLEECCDHLDIRPSTARMHLGQLFAKTGVQRQGQLISLLLKSVGIVRTTGVAQNTGQANQCTYRSVLNGRYGRSHGHAPEIQAAALEALDLPNIGVGVTNGLCQLLLANQTAQQILSGRHGPVTVERGLGIPKKSGSPPLNVLIQQAVQDTLRGMPAPRDIVLAVRRPFGKRPLTLLIHMLQGGLSQSDLTVPAILFFLLDPEFPEQTAEAGLHQLYGLTSSEARLAHLLMEGNTLDDCCGRLDIRPSTARMHLANLFAKTGVQRQGQLISLLLKSVGMLRLRSGEGLLKEAAPQYRSDIAFIQTSTRVD